MTWATSVPILVFLGFSVLDLGPMYATDRRQTRIVDYCHTLEAGSNNGVKLKDFERVIGVYFEYSM